MGTLGSGIFFDKIARHYDITNTFMSFNQDKSWRKAWVEKLNLKPTDRILDVATGTGEVALLMAKHVQQPIIGIDPSVGMMEVGREKAAKEGFGEHIKFLEGDVQNMDVFEDDSFDVVTMAFGIRNVPNRTAGLQELRRVTRAGGKASIMEFQMPREGFLAPAAKLFIQIVIPMIGVFSNEGAKQEYVHLRDSIFNFPQRDEFVGIMVSAGFSHCTVEAYFFDVVNVFTCT